MNSLKNATKKHDRNHPGRPDENDTPSPNLLVVLALVLCCWRRENGKPALPAIKWYEFVSCDFLVFIIICSASLFFFIIITSSVGCSNLASLDSLLFAKGKMHNFSLDRFRFFRGFIKRNPGNDVHLVEEPGCFCKAVAANETYFFDKETQYSALNFPWLSRRSSSRSASSSEKGAAGWCCGPREPLLAAKRTKIEELILRICCESLKETIPNLSSRSLMFSPRFGNVFNF